MSKIIILPLVLVGCLLSNISCTSNNADITGYYRYDKSIYYSNPASSHLMVKENAPDYIIAPESLTILHTDDTKEQITGSFEKSKVDTETFNALFIFEMGIPDISGYQQRHQYSINEQYRLYVIDDEVWLARCPRDTMWAIYQLVKVEDSYNHLPN